MKRDLLFHINRMTYLVLGYLLTAQLAWAAQGDVNGQPLGAPPLNLPPLNNSQTTQSMTHNPAMGMNNTMPVNSNQTPPVSPHSLIPPGSNQMQPNNLMQVDPNMGMFPNEPEHQSQGFGSVNDPVFQNVVKKQFPLSPEQIMRLREVMQETQRASAAPIEPPTPTVSTQTVSLAPGTVPPIIRLATGYVSSIVFVDETGQPWPIVGYSIGNPSAFNVQWDQKTNVLMMQGVGAYQSGNLAVQLSGLSMPVMVTIVNDQKVVDYRMDLRLQGRGPNARASLISDAVPGAADPLLLNLLEGIPPQGSEGLTIKGGDAQAWLYNNMIYLRTRLTILSPGWNSTMTSPDGMKAYVLNATPMILASDQGQTITLKVEGL